ncbi:serine hydrolase domain-containing protein [Enterococcus sp. LJL51]|uniref:serine hydrolase domain-containing protein n=1 Tax=Enterococcus sp. LJL51 TaxID=3416656 RepID=UPI003CF7229A
MKHEKITNLRELINQEYGNTAGIIVQKNDENVYEEYFNECTAESSLHVFSVTKSIISALIGIAVERGYIKSIDQKVLDFFPEYVVKDGEKGIQQITVKQLMTMTAPYKHQTEPYTEYFTSSSWVKFSLDLLGGQDSQGTFRYTPLVGPDILTGILIKATGKSVRSFAAEALFAPLGISVKSDVVFHSQEEQLAFYEARNISGWVADASGVNAAGWGLTLTTTDMAKIGQLYLNDGVWEGQQIIPASWIGESTREHSRWLEPNLAYGYLWWVIDEATHSYAAMGDGGNIIYVNSRKNLVIAMTALFMPEAKDRIDFIQKYVEPAFEE